METIGDKYFEMKALCLIGRLDSVLQYFSLLTVATFSISDQFGSFGSFPCGPHEPILLRNPVNRSFACQGHCV